MAKQPDKVYAHKCAEEDCEHHYLSKSEETPTGTKCASMNHVEEYRFTGGTYEYTPAGPESSLKSDKEGDRE